MGALGIDENLMLWCGGRAFGARDLLFGADGDFEIVVGFGGLGYGSGKWRRKVADTKRFCFADGASGDGFGE
jgi:hypothetical protein